jgi:hypothetical protein
MALRTCKEWNAEDKMSAVICYMHYPSLESYLKGVEYIEEEDREEGKQAYRKAKKLYTALSKVFSDDEIKALAPR